MIGTLIGDRSATRSERLVWARAAALGITVVVLYLYGATGFTLAEPDEGRYAEIPKEMLASGDWITPHLNFVKYFEKPPLVYWATATSFLAFGQSELAARLPSVLAAFGTLALTAIVAASAYGTQTALLSTLILATCPFFAFMGIILTLDMSLTFFLTAVYTCMWFVRQGAGRRYARLAWIAAALGVMTKGPVVGVLAAAGTIPFLDSRVGLERLRSMLDLRGILAAMAIGLPWFVMVSWRNPEFLEYFVVEQHIARYLWTEEHGQPIWFFLPLIPAMMLPWSLAPLCEWSRWRQNLQPRSWSPATRFILMWAAAIVGFFSLSTSKLATYVLPALPPLAILLARGMIRSATVERPTFYRVTATALLLFGAGAAIAGAILPSFHSHWRVAFLQPYMVGGGVLLFAGALTIRAVVDQPTKAIAALAATWLLFLFCAMSARSVAASYTSLALAAANAMKAEDRLAVYRHYVQGVPYYSGRRPIMVESWGELDFGSRQGDQSEYFWPEADQLREAWRGPGRLFLIINRKELATFDPPLSAPVTEVASEGKKVLLVNRVQ